MPIETKKDPEAAIRTTLEAVLADGVFLAVRLSAADGLLEACRAAARGGLRLLELTLTTPGAIAAIETLAEDETLLVGGGTVLTTQEVGRVAAAGGRFVLSPVFDPEVLAAARAAGLLYVPGAATPKEILTAHRAGAALVKVFPAGPLGGPDFLRLVRGPLPEVLLVPTSGPSAENLYEYLEAGAVAVGVGREVFPPGFTLDSAERAAKRVREAMRQARGVS